MISNNVKPFESVNVGPGLNHGFTSTGNNGFNSGMEARDSWLPKTVDEMRVDTNPKLEFMLTNLEGPAGAQVKNLGMIGKVEKQKPLTQFLRSGCAIKHSREEELLLVFLSYPNLSQMLLHRFL